ncbi:hypothetical protein EVAR_10883_1 [Eumeta japonica]|uniref:Uncharacterized protein n=1 Tax=Eumeta variegata TaxID=151549 RepID=A0A4C1USR2_EUMVA|nr:hypothetical protein EVAR_10883_1 [Eumeta japonica]
MACFMLHASAVTEKNGVETADERFKGGRWRTDVENDSITIRSAAGFGARSGERGGISSSRRAPVQRSTGNRYKSKSGSGDGAPVHPLNPHYGRRPAQLSARAAAALAVTAAPLAAAARIFSRGVTWRDVTARYTTAARVRRRVAAAGVTPP